MNISRRIFVKHGGLAIASVGLAPVLGPAFLRRAVFGAEPTSQQKKKTLICCFQRGAADGLSMVVPHGDPDLYKLRPEIAIARPQAGKTGTTALDLDGFFGLHPALAPFLPIYKSGHLAIVHAAGSPDATRSHFDAQDYMESGAPGNKSVADGWMSRVVLACPEDRAKLAASPFRAVALGGGMPRSLQGDVGALAIPDLRTFGIADGGGGAGRGKRPGRGGEDAMMAAAMATRPTSAAAGFETLYDDAVGDVLHGTGKESFEAIKTLRSIKPGAYIPANGAQYPNTNFGRSLQQIAQLIKSDVGVEVAFADMGGWDTHINQGAAQGQLALRLGEFGKGIAALYQDLGDRMSDVAILTMSEFGRTARQNGNAGTDHGHATCFFVLGGDVNGGKVLGKWPGLAPEQLNENRDLALTTDFRSVFGEVALRHLGAKGLERVFPGFKGNPADFRGVIRTT
ncbi:MAG: DUF1501 domain-containing protein [Cytophagales bacterium]|nr:DUF1501 domain-containing protein [Armatimonadota bacterium]